MTLAIAIALGNVEGVYADDVAAPESTADHTEKKLSRYDFTIARGESIAHDAVKPIIFVNGAGVGVKQDESIFTSELLGDFVRKPEIVGQRGVNVEIVDLQLKRAAPDAASVLKLYGRFKLSASQDAPPGERTIRIRLPALHQWSMENELLTSSDSQFEFIGRVFKTKQAKDKNAAQSLHSNERSNPTKVDRISELGASWTTWIVAAIGLLIAAIVGVATVMRTSAKSS